MHQELEPGSPLIVDVWCGHEYDNDSDATTAPLDPKLDFFKNVPTVWNESRVLALDLKVNDGTAFRILPTGAMGK